MVELIFLPSVRLNRHSHSLTAMDSTSTTASGAENTTGTGERIFPHGGLCQLEADNDDHGGDHQTGQVFKPGVAVGVFRVGGLFRQFEANQRHNGAGRVGQVVHGVSSDGNGAGQGADNDFPEEKEEIAENAHDPRQSTHGGRALWGRWSGQRF